MPRANTRMAKNSLGGVLCALLGLSGCRGSAPPSTSRGGAQQMFAVTGVVQELKLDGRTAIIRHEAIPHYMSAMTMPFRARDTNAWAGLEAGDQITFRLMVTSEESWIDQIERHGRIDPARSKALPQPPTEQSQTATNLEFRLADIPDFALTNEFGQPLSLHQFQGRAVALTFFFTRCPLPEYCPRLTRNFLEALHRLKNGPDSPTNFHFLSISFDPVDTPGVLRAYARQYGYDSNHWSFVTGNPEHIRELARGFGVAITAEGATYNHGFSTAIFDAGGRLQKIWPIGGDMTDQIVAEIRHGAQRR
jgi:protein SCO1/2